MEDGQQDGKVGRGITMVIIGIVLVISSITLAQMAGPMSGFTRGLVRLARVFTLLTFGIGNILAILGAIILGDGISSRM